MNTPAFLLARAALSLLVWAPVVQQGQGSRAEAAVKAILGTVGRPASVVRAADELAALGPTALEPLFECLCASEQGIAPLGTFETAAIHGALAQLPREALLPVLARETRASDDNRREAALGVLAQLGGRGELALALELGAPGQSDIPPDTSLREALERAMLGICARDDGATRALAAFFPRVRPAAQTTVAFVVARAGRENAASLLAEQLGSAGVEGDVTLLLALAELGGRRLADDDALVLERVRGNLGHSDRRLRVLAGLAVEKLRDYEAVPELVVMLDDDDVNLRKRAHAALTSLTGLRLQAEPERWLSWLSDGLAWWDERAEPCRVALVSGPPAEAAASVQELAHQRLFVHHAASILALALQRPEPDIVKSACRALATMPGSVTERALLSMVTHTDPTIAAEARAALERCERARSSSTRPSPTLPRLNILP